MYILNPSKNIAWIICLKILTRLIFRHSFVKFLWYLISIFQMKDAYGRCGANAPKDFQQFISENQNIYRKILQNSDKNTLRQSMSYIWDRFIPLLIPRVKIFYANTVFGNAWDFLIILVQRIQRTYGSLYDLRIPSLDRVTDCEWNGVNRGHHFSESLAEKIRDFLNNQKYLHSEQFLTFFEKNETFQTIFPTYSEPNFHHGKYPQFYVSVIIGCFDDIFLFVSVKWSTKFVFKDILWIWGF